MVIINYRNILETSEVTVSSENASFPAYRLYDRNIGKLFKGNSTPANFYITVDQCTGNFEADRLIIPSGHNLGGLALKLQYSTDNFVSDSHDADSWTGYLGDMNRSFSAQTKRFWRLNIASPATAPELTEMYLTKDYTFERSPVYGLIESQKKNVKREESLSGQVQLTKYGEMKRVRRYNVNQMSALQRYNFELWVQQWAGTKCFYVIDHTGILIFMEMLNEPEFPLAILNRYSCDLDLLEVLG